MTTKLTLTVTVKERNSSRYNDPSGYEDIEIPFADGDIETVLQSVAPLVIALARVANAKYMEERTAANDNQ